jgi:hypothetical protein
MASTTQSRTRYMYDCGPGDLRLCVEQLLGYLRREYLWCIEMIRVIPFAAYMTTWCLCRKAVNDPTNKTFRGKEKRCITRISCKKGKATSGALCKHCVRKRKTQEDLVECAESLKATRELYHVDDLDYSAP